ncbi:hypothetical protein OIDMADRAFT_47371 [Oidiodendron maius Zn]|uniref:2EXR domain-containing protein n=1 Tax=Oidiodendron maius (strain Zn) TaxID=913774 RepID=A0A0C3HX09_OIDMZ|nr:hypothetical protein OIDMADRAFT_47371 [Oidiodendron maius Zn]
MTCDAFQLFPLLPPEIRLKVWSFAFPGPRVLEIVWSGTVWAYTPESRPPPNFASFANREANSLFLEKWSRLELLQWSGALKYRPGQIVSYFNPEIDTLYIGPTNAGHSSLEPRAINALAEIPITQSLQHMAFEIREWYNDGLLSGGELDFLSHFPKLESFIIAGYDIDWILLSRGSKRTKGEIQFVNPTKMNMKNDAGVAPQMLKILADLSRSHPEAKIPHATAKEVLRGGKHVDYE